MVPIRTASVSEPDPTYKVLTLAVRVIGRSGVAARAAVTAYTRRTVDEQGSRGTGRRSDDDRDDDVRARETDQEYSWGGKPGEDFGPIAPPGQESAGRPRPPTPLDARLEPGWPAPDPLAAAQADATQHRATLRFERPPRRPGVPLRPDGQFSQAVRRRRPWGAILALLGALVILAGLAGAALYVITGQELLAARQQVATAVASPAAAGSPVPGAPPLPAASPALSAASPRPVATSRPAASPTLLAFGAPTSTPLPTRTPAPGPTARSAPTGLPPPVIFAPPPGLRFASATPIRPGTPQPTRTAPPVQPPRLPTVATRVWSDQVLHRIGEDASICGQSPGGSSAEVTVIAPDRSTRTLGEFPTPSERVCYPLTLDQPELWVLTIIVRDAGRNEIDRQSAALWVSR
jgi:hypothetical protein